MNIKKSFPSRWLKASDLNGRAVKVEIDKVIDEDIGGEDKPVLYFAGKEKGVVLNKTNADVLADAFGDETDEWAGSKVELYPAKTQFQGKLVDCIRVRTIVPAASDDEEPPF